MAIFSSFAKSPPYSPAERTIPHGGLGGLVQLKGKEEKATATEITASEAKGTGAKSPTARKSPPPPPPPIRINSVAHVDTVVHSSPFHRRNHHTSPATLWKASHPPIKFTFNPPIVVTKQDVQRPEDISPVTVPAPNSGLRSETSADRGSENVSTNPSTATRGIQSPVELAGSLLSPSYGIAASARPMSLGDPSRSRAHDERTVPKTNELSIDPDGSSLKVVGSPTPVYRDQELPKQMFGADSSSTSTTDNSPGAMPSPVGLMPVIANVNTISAEDLIRILPVMKTNKLVSEWLPAMEKEIGKYKGLLHMYSNRSEINACHVDSICQDLKNALSQMKRSALSANQSFEKAQADIDELKRTDLEKLQQTEREFQEAFSACDLSSEDIDLQAPEFQRLTRVLYRIVVALGGCIRNNLAFRLYHSPEGLSEEMVKILQAYKLWDDHTLRTFPALVPAEVYENAQQQATQFRQQVLELQGLVAEQQNIISHSAQAYKKLEAELQQQADTLSRYVARSGTFEENTPAMEESSTAAQKSHALDPNIEVIRGEDKAPETAQEALATDVGITEAVDVNDRIVYEQNRVIQDLLRQVHELASEGSLIASDDRGQPSRLDAARSSFDDVPRDLQGYRHGQEQSHDNQRPGFVIAASSPYPTSLPPFSHDSRHTSEIDRNGSDQAAARGRLSTGTNSGRSHSSTSIMPRYEATNEPGHHFPVGSVSEHGHNRLGIKESTTPYPRDSMIATNSLSRLWKGSVRHMANSPPYPTGETSNLSSSDANAAMRFNQIRYKAYSPPPTASAQHSPGLTNMPSSIDSRLHKGYFDPSSSAKTGQERQTNPQEVGKRLLQTPIGHDIQATSRQENGSPAKISNRDTASKHSNSIRVRG